MNLLQTIAKELFGLIVEDFSLALGIGLVLAAAYFVLPWFNLGVELETMIWVLALCAVLLENVVRSARHG